MLINATTFKDYALESLDGPIGKVKQFYFEDRYWTIRYLVAQTSGWLADRQVLLSPRALLDVAKSRQRIGVNLTKKQIEDSPTLESDKPVSRQFEDAYYGYYGWPSPYITGAYPYNMMPYYIQNPSQAKDSGPDKKPWDAHLRSTSDVIGHHVHATDGDIGHVVDFILDDQMWAIRYLVSDTHNWWPGKQVLIAPAWVQSISWEDSKVFVNVNRDKIREAPDYTDETRLTRDYEKQLHRHYNQHGYWLERPAETPPEKIAGDSPCLAEATA